MVTSRSHQSAATPRHLVLLLRLALVALALQTVSPPARSAMAATNAPSPSKPIKSKSTDAKTPATAKADPLDQSQLAALAWRNIGPYRGGRVTAATGVPGQRNVYYFGGTGSGIWKSTNSGVGWTNVSDGQIALGSVGAIAVAPSDPNVIYAGMGEGCIRGNVSHGDGVYKSLDAGTSFKKLTNGHIPRDARPASASRECSQGRLSSTKT